LASHFEEAKIELCVSVKDVEDIRTEAKRRRFRMILAGGISTVVALVGGAVVAHYLIREMHVDFEFDSYPFIPPLAAVGAVRNPRRLGPMDIAIVACVAFLMMFMLVAVAYTVTKPVAAYGVWDRRQYSRSATSALRI